MGERGKWDKWMTAGKIEIYGAAVNQVGQVTEYDDTRTDIKFIPTWVKVVVASALVAET